MGEAAAAIHSYDRVLSLDPNNNQAKNEVTRDGVVPGTEGVGGVGVGWKVGVQICENTYVW